MMLPLMIARTSCAQMDVTDTVSIDRALAAGDERFGQIDVVVNNAGYGEFGVLGAIDNAKIPANFDVNVLAEVSSDCRRLASTWRPSLS